MAQRGRNARISSGSAFEKKAGYSRVVVDGGWVFVSGCTGMDYATGKIADDVAAQAEQTFRNIEWALTQAGVGFPNVVRAQYTFTDGAYFERCMPVMRKWFGDSGGPATTAVVCGLVDPRLKIEIEVTARMPDVEMVPPPVREPDTRV